MRQNLALSLGYNALMVPLAVAGYVTPWLAAAAMSSSSLLVMANSFRAAARRAGNDRHPVPARGSACCWAAAGWRCSCGRCAAGQYEDLEGAANRILFDDEER